MKTYLAAVIAASLCGGFIFSPDAAAKETTASAMAADYHLRKDISSGEASGDYQAFPDMCRMENGDIAAVFYAGESHVTGISEEYPKAGRICFVRSSDEGRTWTKPVVIFDDEHDNRDPHINQMKDGTLVCSFFSLKFPDPKSKRFVSAHESPEIIRSLDNGVTWETSSTVVKTNLERVYSSSQVKEAADGRWLLPLYKQDDKYGKIAYGGVTFSSDQGRTWGDFITIGKESKLSLAAETDIIELKDGTWLAGLRGQQLTPFHFAESKDKGRTWGEVYAADFIGHAPSFTRLKNGAILLNTRGFKKGSTWSTGYTALRVSYDDGKSWQGPYEVAPTVGAYSATVERKDGSVLAIYYDEGDKSRVRVVRFEVPKNTGEKFSVDKPKPLELLEF